MFLFYNQIQNYTSLFVKKCYKKLKFIHFLFHGILAYMKDTIAFWGFPHPHLIEKTKKEYKNANWLDLDVDFGSEKTNILPESCCVIIKNIVNNAIFYKKRIIKILAPIGRDKCDSALFAVEILRDLGFLIETSVFEENTYEKKSYPISKSMLPLRQKVELITKNIIENKDYSNLEESKPLAGFWGVPPNDLSILEIFPKETHIFGWMRCVEAMCPYNLELEQYVNKDVKTVFFAQTFCAKNQLAKYLANKYNGLYIDIDGTSSSSTRAKIEAFLRLR